MNDKDFWKQFELDYGTLASVSNIDWARLAMALDTDGNISIGKHPSYPNSPRKNPTYFAEIKISNTSEVLIDWLVTTFSLRKYLFKARSDKHKHGYIARVTSQAAMEVLIQVRPYLIVKDKQADLAMELQESITNGVHGTSASETTLQHRESLWERARELNKKGRNSN